MGEPGARDVALLELLAGLGQARLELLEAGGGKGEVLELEIALGAGAGIVLGADEMDRSLIADIHPGAGEREVGPVAGAHAEDFGVPGDHRREVVGANVDVIQFAELHGTASLDGVSWCV